VDLAHAGSVADAYELQVRALLVQWPRMPGPVIARRIGWPYSEGSVSLPPTWTARRVRPSGCGRRAKANQVKIVSFDTGPNQVKDLRANTIQALVAQEPALSPMLLLPGRGGLVVVAVGLTRR
jgi:hypothetical protein